jgi:DNA invertase Pin-like site-specific DNA recombinase
MNRNVKRTRVVGYVRVSTDGQAEHGVSLEAQREKLAAYCTALDLVLVEIIEDAGVSAKTLERPGLTQALEALRTGAADALLVTKLDRLTRSVRDLGSLVEDYFASGQWALLSVGDSIDTRSASGRLVLNVLASVAQWEREAIGERTREALAQVKREGGRLGGIPLGWRRTGAVDSHGRRVVEPVADERVTVARIVELRSHALTLREIAATLTREGHPTKRGGQWSAASVRLVLARAV